MKNIYIIEGMTCANCKKSVVKSLNSINGVHKVEVSLESGEATLDTDRFLSIAEIQNILPSKYNVHEKDATNKYSNKGKLQTELQQLFPLFLIFGYLFGAAVFLNFKETNFLSGFMLDFMGLFYIVFSFFKFLDLKGFPASFKMYDPLAKVIPFYGWVYPFIELALGLFFLTRTQVNIALIITIVILGVTTIGVAKVLLDKKSIQCACLGTALKLPMTKATLIENTVMLVMAISMLFMS